MSDNQAATAGAAGTSSYDAARYAAAWQDRRRRMLVFKTLQFAFFVIVIGFAYLSSIHSRVQINPLLALLAWYAVYTVAGVWLNRFRCPRCGKLYYWRLQWKGSLERQKNWRNCHYCGLAQDAGPTPQECQPAADAGKLSSNSFGPRAALAGLLLPAFIVVAGLVLLNVRLVRSDAYKDSLERALASPEVQNVLGSGLRSNYPVLGFELPFPHAHFAEWSLALKGSRGSGHLYGVATQINGSWDVARLVFVSERQKNRVDLTPVHQLRLPPVPHKNVYLVPIGLAQGESLDWAPGYYKAKLGIGLEILPSVPLDTKLLDSARNQLNADRVIEFLQGIHPELARDPSAIVVGVTSSDMYIPGFGPRYAENLRVEGRYAVVSSARLHPPALLGEWNPEWLTSRLQKLLTKNLVILYFGLPMSNDYTSLLSIGVLSGTEIDEMGGGIVGAAGGWDPFPESGDPAVTIYDVPGKEQLWKMTYIGSALPDTATQVFCAELSVGILVQRKADFVFEDEPALQFTRVYRNQDDRSRAFGIGGSDSFDIFLGGQMGAAVDLITDEGARIHFKHQLPKAGQLGDIYQAEWGGGYRFVGTQAVFSGGSWQVKTTDGWTYIFPYRPNALPQYVTVLTNFSDPAGHKYRMERDASGALMAVTSSSGKWLRFENDSAHRIRKVTSSLGRSVRYDYDAGGRMVHATDSEGRVDSYTYDERGQMLTASHGTEKPILTNEYTSDNYIKSQVMGDGRKFGYNYVRGPANVIRENQITDPNGLETYIQYGPDGYLQSLPTAVPH
jgi:YD repeat-containing protein